VSDSITATAGFFWNDAVSPTTATDLITAVETAQANVNAALDAETQAVASAAAAASSALSAVGAQTAAATSETNAATSATSAASSATTAASSATTAASSQTAAASSATSAATQATNAAASAVSAASYATAAGNSQTAAATSAVAAASSATTASNAAATIPAPSVGTATNYIRVNSSGNAYEKRTIAQVATDVGVLNDVGRNKLHNPLFNINQRGVGPFSTLGNYTLDRWVITGTTDAVSIVQQSLADADRTAIGDEEAVSALQNTFTGNAASGASNAIVQRIENVRRLAGKTVTVSFWAKAASGTPKLGVSLDQNWGTGGSPSTTTFGTGASVTLSTTWARKSVTIAIPSSSGKTLGTNGDDYTALNIWYSSGSASASRTGSIGVQAATIQIWGVQLEMGTIVTPLEKPDPYRDMAVCQRFYTIGNGIWGGGTGVGAAIIIPIAFQVWMRVQPTVTQSLTGGAGYTAGTPNASHTVMLLEATGTAASSLFNYSFTATADL